MWVEERRSASWIVAAFIVAALAVFPGISWSVPGDPDNDGLPNWEEMTLGTDPLNADTDGDGLLDGWETAITKTDPLDAHDRDAVLLDGAVDGDAGGIVDGQELSNGSDPTRGADDAKLVALATLSPVSGSSTARTVAPEFSWVAAGGAFVSFVIQFDGSVLFESPVEAATTATALTPEAAQWAAITLKGPRIYWRVIGIDAADQRFASPIGTLVVTGAPAARNPANGTTAAAAARQTFTWAGRGYAGFRLVFTGSHKYGTVKFTLPKSGWFSAATRSCTPSDRQWKSITSLGSVVTWRVVGLDLHGRAGYSQPFTLNLTGGAVSNTVDYAGNPDTIPTFTADFASSSSYQVLFSGSEDFSRGIFTVPTTGFLTGQAITFTPSAAEWNSITSLGAKIFWTVRGYRPAAHAFTYSDIKAYDMGYHDGITELGYASLNSVSPALPTWNFSFSDVTVDGFKFALCQTSRAGGNRVHDPADTWSTGTTWSMPDTLPPMVARLDNDYPFVFVKGKTAAGNSVFSHPNQVATSEFLRNPFLRILGRAVRSNVAYNVSWLPSVDDTGGAVLSYQLQEALDAGFSRGVAYYTVAAGTQVGGVYSLSLKHRVNGMVPYFYRVRALNSTGHSLWSNVRSKTINGGITYVGAAVPPGMSGPNSFIMDDQESNNEAGNLGRLVKLGPGWLFLEWPQSYRGSFQYTTSNGADGSEEFFWIPNIRATGLYEVWVSFFTSSNRSNSAKYSVRYFENGEYVRKYFYVDQNWPISENLNYGNLIWACLGTFVFEKGSQGFVNTFGPQPPFVWPSSVCADGVAFKYIGPAQ